MKNDEQTDSNDGLLQRIAKAYTAGTLCETPNDFEDFPEEFKRELFPEIAKILLDNYSNKLARMKILEPLMIAGDLTKAIDINVNVKGGGWQSQAEASRLAIARALLEITKSEKLKKTFLSYD